MLGVNILEAVTCISLCLFSSQNNKGAFKVFFFLFFNNSERIGVLFSWTKRKKCEES